MVNIIVVFRNRKDASAIRNLLVRNGHNVVAVCSSGSAVMQLIDQMEGSDGLIVSGFGYEDMTYSTLRENIPDTWQMMVLASQSVLARIYEYNVIRIPMPVKAYDLFMSIQAVETTITRERKRRHRKPRERTSAQQAAIENAKSILMEERNMTEEQAHRYLQKTSMDSGTDLAETAQMIIELYTQDYDI